MTFQSVCKTCRKPKPAFACGLCQEGICKSCAEFLTEDFSFLTKIPEDLKHPAYCTNCFDDKISAPLNDYNETMEKAKDIILYSKEQTKITRNLKRKADPFIVHDCEDEQEAILRMSFFAVKGNYNALIDLELKTKKIVIGSHKKTLWSGTAVPISFDPSTIRGHEDPP